MDKKKIALTNGVLIDNYEEVDNYDLTKIVPKANAEQLNGLIIRGYEMKFNNTANENGEIYTEACFDDFINRYFVGKGLNIPVTLMHGKRFEDLCGRVLSCEVNSVGLYFVVYVPKSTYFYERIKAALKEGILQGFSKEGWAVDYEWDKDNRFVVKEFELLNISLVDVPANGINFEKLQETKIENATAFKPRKAANEIIDTIDDWFQSKSEF